jgi:hypothetical protein
MSPARWPIPQSRSAAGTGLPTLLPSGPAEASGSRAAADRRGHPCGALLRRERQAVGSANPSPSNAFCRCMSSMGDLGEIAAHGCVTRAENGHRRVMGGCFRGVALRLCGAMAMPDISGVCTSHQRRAWHESSTSGWSWAPGYQPEVRNRRVCSDLAYGQLILSREGQHEPTRCRVSIIGHVGRRSCPPLEIARSNRRALSGDREFHNGAAERLGIACGPGRRNDGDARIGVNRSPSLS